jgi:hypothetical protein
VITVATVDTKDNTPTAPTHRALGVEVEECPSGKGVGKSVFMYTVFARNLLRNCFVCLLSRRIGICSVIAHTHI